MTENLVTMTPIGDKLKLSGLTECLKDDDCFLDILEEIKLQNQNIAYTSPNVRLMYMILSAGARVHGMNSLLEKRRNKNAVKPPIDLGPLPAEIKPETVKEQPTKHISTKKRVKPEDKVIDLNE